MNMPSIFSIIVLTHGIGKPASWIKKHNLLSGRNDMSVFVITEKFKCFGLCM